MEIRSNLITCATCRPRVRVQDQSRIACTPPNIPAPILNSAPLSHTFHNSCTVMRSQDCAENWKTRPEPLFTRLIAR